jgi:hypothetical protein
MIQTLQIALTPAPSNSLGYLASLINRNVSLPSAR